MPNCTRDRFHRFAGYQSVYVELSAVRKGALFQCTAGGRERLLAALSASLAAREDVLFAYVYGSFAEGVPFHDIDVGVYLSSACGREDTWADIELAQELELALRRAWIASRTGRDRDAEQRPIPVDVRILNEAPIAFGYHVLHGELLFSRDEETRVRWATQILVRYLDLKPLRQRALKEAMASWS